MKRTLIIGASTNPERYAYKAAEQLLQHGHEIELLGNRAGTIFEHEIDLEKKAFEDIDTVTLYLGAKHQPEYYDYIKSLQPKRVVFNPGTENPEFEAALTAAGIKAEEACTLVLLGIGAY